MKKILKYLLFMTVVCFMIYILKKDELVVDFIWYDLWVGIYIDPKSNDVYFCPLPTLVFKSKRK